MINVYEVSSRKIMLFVYNKKSLTGVRSNTY